MVEVIWTTTRSPELSFHFSCPCLVHSFPLLLVVFPSVGLIREDQLLQITAALTKKTKKQPHYIVLECLLCVGLFMCQDFSDSFAASLITDASFISLTHYRSSVWIGTETQFLWLQVRQRHTWSFCWTCRVAVVLAGVQLPSRAGHRVRVSFDWWLIVRL